MVYDEFSSKIKQQYEQYLFALIGRYLALVQAGVEVTPSAVSNFKKAAAMSRETLISTLSQSIDDYGQKYTSKDGKSLKEDIARISLENINTLVLQMKGSQQMMLESIKSAEGAMGQLLQNKLANPEFKVTSVSGRSYKAVPYLENQARHFAYLAWIEKALKDISETSDLAKVVYADQTHGNNGLVFSISGKTFEFPSYDSIKTKIFHYNAQAMVMPNV